MKNIEVSSEFYINHDKFQHFSDKAVDWFIRSYKFQRKTEDWYICRLKQSKYMKIALQHLKQASKCLTYFDTEKI